MKKIILIVTVLFCVCQLNAQESKWQIEPAIMANMFIEVGASNMIYYNINDKYSIVGHTALASAAYSLDISTSGAEQIDSKYRFFLSQKFGIGRRFIGEKSSNGIFLLAGTEYRTFKGEYISPDNKLIESSGKQLHFSTGIMYALQTKINKSKGFSFRVYVPIKPYHILDNILAINFNLGIRFNLKS